MDNIEDIKEFEHDDVVKFIVNLNFDDGLRGVLLSVYAYVIYGLKETADTIIKKSPDSVLKNRVLCCFNENNCIFTDIVGEIVNLETAHSGTIFSGLLNCWIGAILERTDHGQQKENLAFVEQCYLKSLNFGFKPVLRLLGSFYYYRLNNAEELCFYDPSLAKQYYKRALAEGIYLNENERDDFGI